MIKAYKTITTEVLKIKTYTILINLYIEKLIIKIIIRLNSKRFTYVTEAVIKRIRWNLIIKRGKKNKFIKMLNIYKKE